MPDGIPIETIKRIVEEGHKRKAEWLDQNKPQPIGMKVYSGIREDDDEELHRMIWEYVQSSSLAVEVGEPWRSCAGRALSQMITRPFHQLLRLAKAGDSSSIEQLARIAIDSTATLGFVRQKHSRKLAAFASREIAWPVLKSECLHFDQTGKPPSDADRKLFRELKLGRRHPIKGQRWNPNANPPSAALTAIIQEIQSVRWFGWLAYGPQPTPKWNQEARKLPDLSPKETIVEKWWRVVSQLLKETYPTNAQLVAACANFYFPKSKQGSDAEKATWIRSQLRLRLGWMAGSARKTARAPRTVLKHAHTAKSTSDSGDDHFDPAAFVRQRKDKGKLT